MKMALYVESGVTQFVLTGETDWEKKTLADLTNRFKGRIMKPAFLTNLYHRMTQAGRRIARYARGLCPSATYTRQLSETSADGFSSRIPRISGHGAKGVFAQPAQERGEKYQGLPQAGIA